MIHTKKASSLGSFYKDNNVSEQSKVPWNRIFLFLRLVFNNIIFETSGRVHMFARPLHPASYNSLFDQFWDNENRGVLQKAYGLNNFGYVIIETKKKGKVTFRIGSKLGFRLNKVVLATGKPRNSSNGLVVFTISVWEVDAQKPVGNKSGLGSKFRYILQAIFSNCLKGKKKTAQGNALEVQ